MNGALATASSSTIGGAPDRRRQLQPLLNEIGNRLALLLDEAPKPPPGTLSLSPADCNRLEETTGLATTHSPAALVAAVERLASMKVGDIRIPFTPGQLSELQHRAQKRGRTLDQEMKAVVARIEDELFHKGG